MYDLCIRCFIDRFLLRHETEGLQCVTNDLEIYLNEVQIFQYLSIDFGM